LNKKVLVMCTGNSCRSIIGEALINNHLDGIEAKSCGVNPSGKVNINAKKVLQEHGDWKDTYYSKHLDDVIDEDFDLVVTVCDNAKESCPIFPHPIKKIHVGFQDPDKKAIEAFRTTYTDIKNQLLPKVKEALSVKRDVFSTNNGVKINFTQGSKKQHIVSMIENCSTGKCECMSNETKKKIKNMDVSGEDGNVTLNLNGNITEDEIKNALSKSKVIN